MKQSLDDLLAAAHRYYPRGAPADFPDQGQSEEHDRLVAARRRAGADAEPWRAMLRRLRDKFPEHEIEDRAVLLASGEHYACYAGQLLLPTTSPGEHWHGVTFLVSILVPCYAVYSSRYADVVDVVAEVRPPVYRSVDVYVGNTMYVTPSNVEVPPEEQGPRRQLDVSHDPLPDEEPYFAEIAREIEATFNYERMPPEIGNVAVPDLTTAGRAVGEATLYDYLFSESW